MATAADIKTEINTNAPDEINNYMTPQLVADVVALGGLTQANLVTFFNDTDGGQNTDSYIGGNALSILFADGYDITLLDFTNKNISNAYISTADLSGLDFTNCNMESCDLSSCDLTGADLTGANLGGCDVRSSDLTGIIYTACDFSSDPLYSLHTNCRNIIYNSSTTLPADLPDSILEFMTELN